MAFVRDRWVKRGWGSYGAKKIRRLFFWEGKAVPILNAFLLGPGGVGFWGVVLEGRWALKASWQTYVRMAGFLAVAADFSGSWAQVTKVLLFAIPEKNRICFQVFQGVLGGLCWRAQMQYNGTVLQKQRLPTACLFVEPFQMIGFDWPRKLRWKAGHQASAGHLYRKYVPENVWRIR